MRGLTWFDQSFLTRLMLLWEDVERSCRFYESDTAPRLATQRSFSKDSNHPFSSVEDALRQPQLVPVPSACFSFPQDLNASEKKDWNTGEKTSCTAKPAELQPTWGGQTRRRMCGVRHPPETDMSRWMDT